MTVTSPKRPRTRDTSTASGTDLIICGSQIVRRRKVDKGTWLTVMWVLGMVSSSQCESCSIMPLKSVTFGLGHETKKIVAAGD